MCPERMSSSCCIVSHDISWVEMQRPLAGTVEARTHTPPLHRGVRHPKESRWPGGLQTTQAALAMSSLVDPAVFPGAGALGALELRPKGSISEC